MSSPPYILLYTPHSPVICKDFFSLIYIYKSSTTLYLISIWVLFSLSQHLSKALKPAPLQPIKHLAYIASNLLVSLLSPFIAIHSHYFLTGFTIFTQRILPLMLSFDFVPLDRAFGAQAHKTVIRCPNSHNLATRTH